MTTNTARVRTSTGKVHAANASLRPACSERIIGLEVEADQAVTCRTCQRVLRAYPIETPEYAAMMRRMVAKYGERVGAADPIDLTEMMVVKAEFDAAIRTAVRGLRESFTWREIGEALGTSKEAAIMRFGERDKPRKVAGDLPGQTSILEALEAAAR